MNKKAQERPKITLTLLLCRWFIRLCQCKPEGYVLCKRELEQFGKAAAEIVGELHTLEGLAYDGNVVVLRSGCRKLLREQLQACLILYCLQILHVHVADQRAELVHSHVVPVHHLQLPSEEGA